MIALLCLKTAPAGAAICRVDPREDRPAVQIYDDASAALEWFTRILRTSRKMAGTSSTTGCRCKANLDGQLRMENGQLRLSIFSCSLSLCCSHSISVTPR